MDYEYQVARCVVRIILPNGNVAGSGFFVLPDGHVVTCYHVVRPLVEHLDEILVEHDGIRYGARFCPDKSAPSSDIAVLRIQRDAVSLLPYLALAAPQLDTRVRAYGYRSRLHAEYHVSGTLRAGQPLPRVGHVLNMETAMPDAGSVVGMSGAPVYRPDSRAVVGVFYAEEQHGPSVSYVHSVEKVFESWPDLRTRIAEFEGRAVESVLPELRYANLFKISSVVLPYAPMISAGYPDDLGFPYGAVRCETIARQYVLPPDCQDNPVDDLHGDDQKCRLAGYAWEITGRSLPNLLNFTFSPVKYSDYLRTGPFLDAPLPDHSGPTYRDKYAPDANFHDIGNWPLSNICGVGVFILTCDGRLVVSRHSPHVRVSANMWGYAACGTMDWKNNVNPFDEINRESEEELDHQLNMEQTYLFAVGIDTKAFFVQFSFVEKSHLPFDEIASRALVAPDYDVEVAQLKSIRFDLNSILGALEEGPWEPAATAGLLLLSTKKFGRDTVERAIGRSDMNERIKQQMRLEWGHRASRPGHYAVMSARFPRQECEAESERYADAVLEFIGEDVDGATVLEVGGGVGRLSKPLAMRCRQLTCVDISDEMIVRNKKHLGSLVDKVEYFLGFIQDYEPTPHDVAISSQVLNHCVDDEFFHKAVAVIAESADTVFLFENADVAQEVSSATRVRSEDQFKRAFSGYIVERRRDYVLFNDRLVFLKLVRG